jgi:hypothetical protein
LDDSSAVFSSAGTVLSMTGGFGFTLPYAVNIPLRCPVLTALTNGAYGSKISAGGTAIAWESNFTLRGNWLIWSPASGNGRSVVLSETDEGYFWDQSTNQINAALSPAITPGSWHAQMQNTCVAPTGKLLATVH